MHFLDKHLVLFKNFYLMVLGLTIPFYLMSFGASSHQFAPPVVDLISLTAIVIAFVSMMTYLRFKNRSGLLYRLVQVIVTVTLLLTAYGGIRVFMYVIQFDYGNDTGVIIRGLSYFIPLLFTLSTVVILLELFKKRM